VAAAREAALAVLSGAKELRRAETLNFVQGGRSGRLGLSSGLRPGGEKIDSPDRWRRMLHASFSQICNSSVTSSPRSKRSRDRAEASNRVYPPSAINSAKAWPAPYDCITPRPLNE
jgi:hypothetical protein